MEPIIVIALFWLYYRTRTHLDDDGPQPVLNSEDSHEWMRVLIDGGVTKRQLLHAMGVRSCTLKSYYRYDLRGKTKPIPASKLLKIRQDARRKERERLKAEINASSLHKLESSIEKRERKESVLNYYFSHTA